MYNSWLFYNLYCILTLVYQSITDVSCAHQIRNLLIPRDSIYSICWNILKEVRNIHKNENIALKKWKTSLEENGELTYYQGGDNINRGENNFILAFQSQWQKSKLFEQKTFCLDSTHNTNHYNFHLFTLLTKDKCTGRGVAVAWMISAKKCTNTLKLWYEISFLNFFF